MELVPTNCNIWQKLLKTSAPAEMLVAELLDSDLNVLIRLGVLGGIQTSFGLNIPSRQMKSF